MERLMNVLLRNDLLDAIPAEDLTERQKFKLFRVYVLTTFICSTFTGQQVYTSFEGGHVLGLLICSLSLVFVGCYFLVRSTRQLSMSYLVSLIAGCAVLHIQAYNTGGVLNTGTIYFCAAIMTAYMLLGAKRGRYFIFLGLSNVIFFYLASDKFGIADYAMLLTDSDRFDDAGLTFVLGLTFVGALSHNLLNNKNEVIKQIEARKIEVEVKNNQLSTYTEVLERKNEELDKFASIVSHDLKAPLRAIANLTDWIGQDAGEILTGENKSNFELIKQRVRRMEDLIDAILQYSRADRTVNSDELVDSGIIVQESMDFIGRPSHVQLTIASELPVIVADHTRINQVFTNLFTNAVKYCDKSNVEITVSAEECPGGHVFSVKDNGPGIDPRFHERIFVIFQTLQRRDVVESTGVGLAIVKKIIEDQGGKVWVESVPGHGADFRFFWPSSRKNAHTELGIAA